MNRLQKDFYIFICLVIFSYVMDIATSNGIYKKCIHSPAFHIDLFFHHFINIFSQFGWLSSNICTIRLLDSAYCCFNSLENKPKSMRVNRENQ